MGQEALEVETIRQEPFAGQFSGPAFKEFLYRVHVLNTDKNYSVERMCRHQNAKSTGRLSRGRQTNRGFGAFDSPRQSEADKSLQLMSYCNRDRMLYNKILTLLTPIGAETPILTYRNVRCLVFLIVN